ncbi:MAG TPA: pantoate--beta-alanine ligase [Gemmatimonadota bacterium]|nr:pantoate--beta-alanine ligase [Gemmatimonadota bacterium]
MVREPEAAREAARALRGARGRLGLVPTMGSLHDGHLSLIERARAACDAVAVSVFVNPTQFGPGEDYDAYPRDLDRDVELAGERGVDLVFAPTPEAMYPAEPSLRVEPGRLGERLCGLSRPGHFSGVLTVVLKLFHILEPDVAVFGRKDFQQSVLVRRMTEELNLPIEVVAAPIVRAADGLALSSRNAYLSEEERERALSLSGGLRLARERFAAGERDAEALADRVRGTMESAGVEVEYVEIVEPGTLEPLARAAPDAVCAVAARVGSTRLIDNATLGGASSLDGIRGA